MGIFGGGTARRLLLAGGGVIALAAGVSDASAESVIRWLHVEANADNLAVWQDIADRYMADHPDVKIEFQFLENEAFKAKLPTLLQSDDAPSMFYSWGGGVLKAQSETGALRDITAALDADGGAWRNSLNAAAVDGLTFDDKVWAAPFKSGVVSFFYNKEQFEKAGVDATQIKTWSDFVAAVQKLKDAGITPIAGGGGDKWPIHFYWSYLAMREAGKELFDQTKAHEGDGFTAEPFVKAGELLADLGKLEPFQNGYLGATWNDTLAAFGDGRAAILLGFENTYFTQASNSTDGKGLAADNIGRFPFPVVEGAPGVATDDFGGLNGWAVTAVAPPETEDFLKFYTNLENEKLLAAKTAILPTTKGAAEAVTDPLLKQAADQMAEETWHQNYLDQDLGPNVGRVVNDMSVGIVAGQISPEDAVQQIQDAFSMEM
ncbi:extracellular solute-binding protein [Consotaella aegiceratis]|uniref:extracellular solute-binding protein n=1 Tax=Consotaella aegiceratis TaxID=3097961 RepID=UPI002F41EACD